MFDGKLKAVTLSYDDGVREDYRLIEIMRKHGLRGTFNIKTVNTKARKNNNRYNYKTQ